MGQDGDLPVSLPSPPPPRPAARREAIDAALRRFDGIEEAPAKSRASRPGWVAMNRRPIGALAAAAVVAILGIPAIQIAIRDNPTPSAEDIAAPDRAAPAPSDPSPVTSGPASPPLAEPVAEDIALEPAERREGPPSAEQDRIGFDAGPAAKAARAAPSSSRAPPAAPMMAAPEPPSPPPPPPAEPQAQAEASGSDSIVVTGSRVRRSHLESASPITVIDNSDAFLSQLRDALAANDRNTILALVALPLKVDFGGDVRTYRTRRDIDRDFARIFSAAVRQSADDLHADALTSRDGGRLRGNGRLWFGCGKRSCTSGERLRIREVRP